MHPLLYNIGQVLGISIIHSLWQGLIVYLLVRLYGIAFPAAAPAKKYYISFIGLCIIAAWFGYTFFNQANSYNWSTASNITAAPAPGTISTGKIAPHATPLTVPDGTFPVQRSAAYHFIQTYLPYISIIYCIGLIINLARLFLDWQHIRIIKQTLGNAGPLQQSVNHFVQKLGIGKAVAAGYSQLVDGPCVIGYLKPILLLPVSIATQLSAEETEAILLHELAHIKHNDYLLNLIQQVIAVLLFLNPFAVLLNRMISAERENRCDDVVLQFTHQPLVYAQALVKLEEERQSHLQLALAATGAKYQLFARIQRIMKANKPTVNIKHLVLALVIFIGSLGSISWLNPEIKNGRIVSKHATQAIHQLSAMVKHIISPAKPIADNVMPDTAKHKLFTDTTKKAAALTALNDTDRTESRAELLLQWQRSRRDLDNDRQQLDALPEIKELRRANAILDSMRKVKYVPIAALQQKAKDDRAAWDAFWKSPEQLKKQAIHQKYLREYLDALHNYPEIKEYETHHKLQYDSIKNILMQRTGLTERALDTTNKEWQDWLKEANIKLDALHMKALANPYIKAKYDSLEISGNALYSGPEFDAMNQKTRLSKEQIDQMETRRSAGVEEYIAAVKSASAKAHNTPEWKKYDDDIKKDNEIVRKLKAIK